MNEIIYIIKHPTTREVRYVGQTTMGEKRFYSHIIHAKFYNRTPIQKFLKSLLDVGLYPIYEVQEICGSRDILDEREIYWINYYKSNGSNLLNITSGGYGKRGFVTSLETKNKQSLAAKGRVIPEIVRNKIRNTLFGRPGNNKGKTYSEETRLKMSVAKKGIPNKSLSKKVLYNGIEYASLKEASGVTGIKRSTLWRVCNGVGKNINSVVANYI